MSREFHLDQLGFNSNVGVDSDGSKFDFSWQVSRVITSGLTHPVELCELDVQGQEVVDNLNNS